MIRRILIALALVIFVAPSAYAQIDLSIRGPVGEVDKKAPVSGAKSREYFQKCSNHLPRGFTPKTRDEFCTCSSVAVTQMLTHEQLELVEGEVSKDPQFSAALIRFAEGAVVPCMDAPIRTLAYITCLEERSQDHRIRNFPAYCGCVGDYAAARLNRQGAKDMITHYTSFEDNPDFRLVESFMNSPPYRRYVIDGMRACIQPAFMTR